MRIDRRSVLRLFAAPALLGSLRMSSAGAQAEQYPAKPVRIIVPYPRRRPL